MHQGFGIMAQRWMSARAYDAPPSHVRTITGHHLTDGAGSTGPKLGGNATVGHDTPRGNGIDDVEYPGYKISGLWRDRFVVLRA
jgi:hypothetical protein